MTPPGSAGNTRRYRPICETANAAGAHIALVPGEDAPLIGLSLPEGLRGGAREQVAKRQAADTLGLSGDALDVRPFLQGGPAWTRVLVTAPDKIEQWGRQVSGTACTEILPDYLSLAAAEHVWTIERHDQRLLVRLGPGDGFSGELPVARLQLTLALAQAPPRAVLWTGPGDPEIEAAFQAADVAVLADPAGLKALGLQLPRDAGPGGINLRDLAGAAQARRRARIVRWRAPVILAILAFGLWLSAQWIAIARDNAHTREITTATTNLVRQYFVPTGPLLDIRAQVARKAAQLSQTPDNAPVTVSPVTLLRRAATPLTGPGLTLQSASYRAGSGFELSVGAPDFAALDTLARALRAAGLAVEMTSAASDGEGGVFGQIQITEPS